MKANRRSSHRSTGALARTVVGVLARSGKLSGQSDKSTHAGKKPAPPFGGVVAFVSAIADLLARYAKISAAVVGLVYGIGFLVTASRMAEYDIPVSTLISAQYLMAGLFPSAMLCLTAFVAFWGFRYRNTDGLGPLGRFLFCLLR